MVYASDKHLLFERVNWTKSFVKLFHELEPIKLKVNQRLKTFSISLSCDFLLFLLIGILSSDWIDFKGQPYNQYTFEK